jgi:hypothetical protein
MKRKSFVSMRWCAELAAIGVMATLPLVGSRAVAQSGSHARAARPASAEAQVIAAETALMRSESTANYAALKATLAPDFMEADKAILNRDQLVEMIRVAHSIPCKFGTTSVKDPIVTMLEPGIATIAYRATQSLTCGQHVLNAEGNISSVWVLIGRQWKTRLHSEIIVNAK